MVTPVDPNEVRLTGENSFIRLSHQDSGSPLTAYASHWRILLSPGGPGHVLFLQTEMTDNQLRIYTDNIAMTRWIQGEIVSMLNPPFADEGLTVAEAVFSRYGDLSSFCTEKIVSRDEEISMTWFEFGEPYQIRFAPGTIRPTVTHGVYSVLTPANKAQLVINGNPAPGKVFPAAQGGHDSTSCCLAWSETWVRPR